MKPIKINNKAFNLNLISRILLFSVLFGFIWLNLSEIAFPNRCQKYCFLKMKLLGENNKAITEKVIIKWFDLRDIIGPNEEFNIELKDDIFSVKLPDPSVYYFTIEAEGYLKIQNKKVEIKKDIETLTIVMTRDTKTAAKNTIFGPVASGFWYPNDKTELAQIINSYLLNANAKKLNEKIVAVIAPHAGLQYSGPCAAYSFKPLSGQNIDRVILLAPSHIGNFRGLSIKKADYYQTPLGLIKIDTEVCDYLLTEKLINTQNYVHEKEHSLEIQLPFLQLALKNFKLIPILVGVLEDDDYSYLAKIINKYVDEKTIIVVSSDFTHYGYNYGYMPFPYNKDTRNKIENLDKEAIEKIINLDFLGFQNYLKETEITICGRIPIGLLLNILGKNVKGELSHYYLSGDKLGNYENSVSYASIKFYK